MCRSALTKKFMIGFFLLTVAFTLLPLSSQAGEIYGRVAKNGRAFPDANISINCDHFEDSKTTDQNGVYRFSGPEGEEKCTISVDGSNPVEFFTSRRRTRVNLEIINNRLYRR